MCAAITLHLNDGKSRAPNHSQPLSPNHSAPRHPTGQIDDKSPKEALGMFRSWIHHVWTHAVIFAWSDLILDRSRKLAGL